LMLNFFSIFPSLYISLKVENVYWHHGPHDAIDF
jgi:hypothetical protein